MAASGDKYRVAAPAATFVPQREDAEELRTSPLVSKDGLRSDGRRMDSFRPLFMRTAAVPQANGSAYMEMDKTKVICAVYGPRQGQRQQQFSESGQLQCTFKYAPFAAESRRSKASRIDAEEQEHSISLEHALASAVRLETFPKAVVDVYVTVLEDDGSAVAAAISCASLALADAGIQMLDLLAACSAGFVKNKVMVDCTKTEEKGQSGLVTVAHLASLNTTAHTLVAGEVPSTLLLEAIDMCIDGAAKVHAVMQESLAQSAAKRLKKRRRDDA